MEVTKSKTVGLARFNYFRHSTFAVRHFTCESRHESQSSASAHFKKLPPDGAVNQTSAAIRNHTGRLDPPVRCIGGIHRLPATKRESRRNDLGSGPRALSKNKMARPRKSSCHAG